ncbi:MAG TPA: phosphatase PAP2 family protein [Conexibacter sp.]|nr:phosphatase PAP2 family protein [Conexibacter sp.]
MPARPLRPLPLAALAVGCALALVVAYVVFVRTHAGQRVDGAALDGRLASFHARHAASQLLTTISVGSLALILALLVAQALLRRRVALAVVAVVVVLGALTLTEVLKHLVLVRPDLVPSSLDHNSFPSGHTTTAFAAGIAATLAAPARWRRAVAAGALLYGTAIGIATIAAGWHRPSDVAGAMLVVTGWAAAVVLVVALVRPDAFGDGRTGESTESRSTWARTPDLEGYVLLAAVLLVSGWLATVAIVGGSRVGAIELTTLNATFVGACACVAALAALLLAALLTVLRESLPARGA